jgi:ABC-type uncharacterized transport system involved in gliding motility auxiliary subunit
MANRIFNLIGWLGTGLVLGAVIVRFGSFGKDQYATYLAMGGLGCMVIYILSQWREVLAFFGTRNARYGALSAASVLIVAAILIAVNYIGARKHKRWDFTATRQYSLADQSRDLVAKLDAPLDVMVFATDRVVQQYRDQLNEYGYASPNVKTQFIDPVKQPAIAESNQVQQDGTVILKYKDRTERITSSTEQDVTGAIIKLTSGRQRKVYFTNGHNEKDLASTERDGYSGLTEALKRENYTFDSIVLAQKPTVPDDAAVLVVAGPKIDFFQPEIDSIKAYLQKGGKLALLIDPPDRADSPPLTNLLALAHDWGITLGDNIVVDVSGRGQIFGASEAVPVAARYLQHPITQRFRTMTAYPLARSVEPVPGGVNGHTAQGLVQTSEESWAETDLKTLTSGGGVKLDAGKDQPGPITLAAAVSSPVTDAKPATDTPDTPKPETRVVVFGDSDFAANGFGALAGNRDFFMNALGWLSQQENLISIRPREPEDRRLEPMSVRTQAAIIYGGWLGLPLLVFGIGIFGWWRRR